MKLGDTVELVCKIRNLPANQEIHWFFNENKINANVVYKASATSKEGGQQSADLVETASKHTKDKPSHPSHHSKSKRFDHTSPTFAIELDKLANNNNNQNLTTSKLIIKDLDHHHKGSYKCKYDKVEAKYHLDLKLKGQYQSPTTSLSAAFRQLFVSLF